MSSPSRAESLWKLKDFISPLLSIIAISLSSYSLYISDRTHRDVARADAIKTEYDLFNNLSRAELQYPLMSHLFAVTGLAYDSSSAQVASAVSASDKATRTRLLLEERAMAHYIFTTYEETYYNWEHAEKVGDSDRAKLVREHLDYFKDQLCNRRLLWYWDVEKGDQLGLLFAERVQKFYQDNSIKDCAEENDADGPFNHAEDKTKKKASSPQP